jgi:hypothetical protein
MCTGCSGAWAYSHVTEKNDTKSPSTEFIDWTFCSACPAALKHACRQRGKAQSAADGARKLRQGRLENIRHKPQRSFVALQHAAWRPREGSGCTRPPFPGQRIYAPAFAVLGLPLANDSVPCALCVLRAGGLNWEELRNFLNELHPQRQNDITEGEVRMSRSRQRGGPAEREADTKDSCGTRHTAAQTTATWHCSYVSAALFKVTDCPTNLDKGLTAAALFQMKWVIQMATPDTQPFEGEWMSGTKQVTCGVHGIFLTPKKRAPDCTSITHAHTDTCTSITHAHTDTCTSITHAHTDTCTSITHAHTDNFTYTHRIHTYMSATPPKFGFRV